MSLNTILHAEDDDLITRLMEMMINKYFPRFKYKSVKTAEEFLEIYRKAHQEGKPPYITMTDYNLDGRMKGADALATLAREGTLKADRTLLCSGDPGQEGLDQIEKLGISFIPKPIPINEIRLFIERAQKK